MLGEKKCKIFSNILSHSKIYMVHIVLAPAFAIAKVTARYYSIGVGVEDGGGWSLFKDFSLAVTPPPHPFT